uniref:Dpy-30 n=1 Tax=Panagrellus redivivus TaxID=6233 RepID=A0A7E4UP84_PANRE
MSEAEQSTVPTAEPVPVEPKPTEQAPEPMDTTTAPAAEAAAAPARQQSQAEADAAAMPPPDKPVGATASADSSGEVKKNDQEVNRIALANIPTRQYLDQTVVPVLLQGLGAVAKERPQNPIVFLAEYLLKENARINEAPQQ